MNSNHQNSNDVGKLSLNINLPKTGLFHFGFLWGLAPSIILILIHTNWGGERFLMKPWLSTFWTYSESFSLSKSSTSCFTVFYDHDWVCSHYQRQFHLQFISCNCVATFYAARWYLNVVEKLVPASPRYASGFPFMVCDLYFVDTTGSCLVFEESARYRRTCCCITTSKPDT